MMAYGVSSVCVVFDGGIVVVYGGDGVDGVVIGGGVAAGVVVGGCYGGSVGMGAVVVGVVVVGIDDSVDVGVSIVVDDDVVVES